MKKFIIILALISASIFSKELNLMVEDYKQVPGMDYQIELVLKDEIPQHRLLLDCQSFINGLYLQNQMSNKWRQVWFIMMSGNECEDASNFSKSLAENDRSYCLVVDPEEKYMSFNEDLASCSEE